MILHVDMDAFYASVEERDNPSLVGKPVIVGGTADSRGVVAAANYEARKYGVHSAMAASRARQLCPHAIVIKPRIGYYAEISQQIRSIFEDYTPVIEPLSLDEAFLDATPSETLFGGPKKIGRLIKERIRAELRLVASVGIAPNKFLAKIASDLQKPDGFVVVPPNGVQVFLDPLPVGRIWGVGKVTGKSFERLCIETIGQLRKLPLATLEELFGASGRHYWELAQGIDDRAVIPDREAKSISHETTFPVDIADFELLRAWLVELVEQVGRRLRRHELKGQTAEIKVRFADFSTITRSMKLRQPSHVTQELLEAGLLLLNTRLPENHLPIRLLGFGVSRLKPPGVEQRDLFHEAGRTRQRQLDQVADEVSARFGIDRLRRGSGLGKKGD